MIGNPLGNVIGNPLQTPIGNVIGNPLQTPDVTQGPDGGQAGNPNQNAPKYRVYVGTYTNGKGQSEGIYQFDLDLKAGTTTNPTVAAQTTNPSFLAIHPSGKVLYAVNEIGQYGGKPSGSVSSFAIDPKSGSLALLNTVSSGGADPCYVAVDATGSDVLVANYTGGSVSVFPVLGPDGKLGPTTAMIQHKGSSANKSRQAGPHAHAIDLSPSNRYAVVPDLGLDKLMVYHFDPKAGSLKPNIPAYAELPPGSGPRQPGVRARRPPRLRHQRDGIDD